MTTVRQALEKLAYTSKPVFDELERALAEEHNKAEKSFIGSESNLGSLAFYQGILARSKTLLEEFSSIRNSLGEE